MLEVGTNKAVISQSHLKKKRIHKNVRFIKLTNALLGLLLPAILLLVWETAGKMGFLNPILLPTPSSIWQEFVSLAQSGELGHHLRISTWRALVGFGLGGGLGLAAGILVGFSYKTERLLDPTLQMLRTLPHLAIAPLFILWFGFGETSKILLIAKGAFFPLYVNTFLGIRSFDNKLFDVAKVLQYSHWQTIIKLIIPASLPNIFLGVRLSLGVAWMGLVVAELMGSSAGIGYLLNDARSFSLTSLVFVGIIIFALLGKLSDSLVLLLERKLLSWQEVFKGGKGHD
jgi:sulfonate transport system permease protein